MTPAALPAKLLEAVDIAVRLSFDMSAAQQLAAAGDELECIGCGCTDSNGCPGGCSWASVVPPICSVCAEANLV